MYCSRCGEQLGEEDAFCKHCGASQKPRRSKWGLVALIIATGLAILIGLVKLFIWPTKRPQAPVASVSTANAKRVEPPAAAPKAVEQVPVVAETPRPDRSRAKTAKPRPLRPLRTVAPIVTAPLAAVNITPPCAVGRTPERPNTGERIEPDVGTSGRSSLEISNGLSVDAAVRLVDSSTNTTSRFVYVRAHDNLKIGGIQPSTYYLRFASGLDWIPACADFLRDENINEFEETFPFQQETVKDGDYYKTTWTKVSASLNPVLEGTVSARKIDRERFLQGDQHFSVQPQ